MLLPRSRARDAQSMTLHDVSWNLNEETRELNPGDTPLQYLEDLFLLAHRSQKREHNGQVRVDTSRKRRRLSHRVPQDVDQHGKSQLKRQRKTSGMIVWSACR